MNLKIKFLRWLETVVHCLQKLLESVIRYYTTTPFLLKTTTATEGHSKSKVLISYTTNTFNLCYIAAVVYTSQN